MFSDEEIDAMPLLDLTKDWLKTPEGAAFLTHTLVWPMQFPPNVLSSEMMEQYR